MDINELKYGTIPIIVKKYLNNPEISAKKIKIYISENINLISDIEIIFKYKYFFDFNLVFKNYKYNSSELEYFISKKLFKESYISFFSNQKINAELLDSFFKNNDLSDKLLDIILKYQKLDEEIIYKYFPLFFSNENFYKYQNFNIINFEQNLILNLNIPFLLKHKKLSFEEYKLIFRFFGSPNFLYAHNMSFNTYSYIKKKYYVEIHKYIDYDKLDYRMVYYLDKLKLISKSNVSNCKNESIINTIFTKKDFLKYYYNLLSNPKSELFLRKFIEITEITQSKRNNKIWNLISSQNINEEFVNDYIEFINLKLITNIHEFSNEFIKKFCKSINWDLISQYKNIEPDFLSEFYDYINMDLLLQNINLDSEFAKQINFKYLDDTNSEKFKYIDNYFYKNLLTNKLLYVGYIPADNFNLKIGKSYSYPIKIYNKSRIHKLNIKSYYIVTFDFNNKNIIIDENNYGIIKVFNFNLFSKQQL